MTKSGTFFALRCAECATIKGGENAGTTEPVPFNPQVHVNEYQ